MKQERTCAQNEVEADFHLVRSWASSWLRGADRRRKCGGRRRVRVCGATRSHWGCALPTHAARPCSSGKRSGQMWLKFRFTGLKSSYSCYVGLQHLAVIGNKILSRILSTLHMMPFKRLPHVCALFLSYQSLEARLIYSNKHCRNWI